MGKERSALEEIISTVDHLQSGIADCKEFLEMAELDDDVDTFQIVIQDIKKLQIILERLEFKKMFSNPMEPAKIN